MMNTTLATADATLAHAMQAATRPLAGIGAGAFACEGTRVGYVGGETAALALPRIRSAFAATSQGQLPAGGLGGSYVTGLGYTPARRVDGKQLNQTTRVYPVIPGGVGPHPAREPEPV